MCLVLPGPGRAKLALPPFVDQAKGEGTALEEARISDLGGVAVIIQFPISDSTAQADPPAGPAVARRPARLLNARICAVKLL